jgi:hypothetical protein
MRKFLLGEWAFAVDMALSLAIPLMPVRLIGFQLPFETTDGFGSSTFHRYVPGLNFTLWTGTDSRDAVSRLLEPSVPPKRLIFTSYCRLLPPREIAKSF